MWTLESQEEGEGMSSQTGGAQTRRGLMVHAEDLILIEMENQWWISAGDWLV